MAHATTKEIAKAAGFSEATLYKHFQDKTELFVAVLAERLPRFVPLIAELTSNVGERTVVENLRRVVAAAVVFYTDSFPISVSIFAEPKVLTAHRAGLRRSGAGPHKANAALAEYLAAERELGRIRPDADPNALAALLLGACFQHAFLQQFADPSALAAPPEEVAETLVDALAPALVVGPVDGVGAR